MSRFQDTADTARRLVLKNGRLATFHRLNTTAPDAAKPWRGEDDPRSTPAEVVADVPVVALPLSSASSLGIKTDGSELWKRAQRVLIVAPGSAEQTDLSFFNEVIDEGAAWAIEVVETLRPSETNILYFMGVRR